MGAKLVTDSLQVKLVLQSALVSNWKSMWCWIVRWYGSAWHVVMPFDLSGVDPWSFLVSTHRALVDVLVLEGEPEYRKKLCITESWELFLVFPWEPGKYVRDVILEDRSKCTLEGLKNYRCRRTVEKVRWALSKQIIRWGGDASFRCAASTAMRCQSVLVKWCAKPNNPSH